MTAVATTPGSQISPGTEARCFHCGTPCPADPLLRQGKAFCCQGCVTVFELLSEHGLSDFYRLAETAGVKARTGEDGQFGFLDEPSVRARLVNFQDGRTTRVTFYLPAMHCLACVWLLENLFRLKPGIGKSQVNFPRKEVSILFEDAQVTLSDVAVLLASLGYEPELKLADLQGSRRGTVSRELWLQLGVAGFAFGNLMLLALGVYFGVDGFSGPAFRRLAGFAGLFLSLPVVTYGARHYWRTAWVSLKQRRLAIEVPIAIGIIAIFSQSAYEVLSRRGEGYFDSLSGLIFLLLCGRLFQQKTFDRLNFERDYQSFFPLSVTRRTANGTAEERIAIAQLEVGDVLLIRNGELIPADSCLLSGEACIDYSFVTGEAEPVARRCGEHLYAGGRQIGPMLEIALLKPVSQSYLTSLWNQEVFRKDKHATFETLINKFSYRFTLVVSAVALGAAAWWWPVDPAKALKAFASVLIVACPCALALAAPFTLGTAIRALARRGVFVKSPEVIEAMSKVDGIVFDKTGTLTTAGVQAVHHAGEPLSGDERRWIASLALQSTHPLSVRIADTLAGERSEPVRSLVEYVGCGVEGMVSRHQVRLGSAAWLEGCKVTVPHQHLTPGPVVHLAIDGRYRGCFILESSLRSQMDRCLQALRARYELTLLSGDNGREEQTFVPLFGASTRFDQSPLDKLEFIRSRQQAGHCVMMVGDGLNDAGALKQSDVGVAVVESVSAFSPASDVILQATMVPHLDSVLRFSRHATRIVRLSFLVSSCYNVIGLSIAAAGLLSPVVCAALMPVSSVSVIAFACGATTWAARLVFAHGANLGASAPRNGESHSLEKPMLSPLT